MAKQEFTGIKSYGTNVGTLIFAVDRATSPENEASQQSRECEERQREDASQ